MMADLTSAALKNLRGTVVVLEWVVFLKVNQKRRSLVGMGLQMCQSQVDASTNMFSTTSITRQHFFFTSMQLWFMCSAILYSHVSTLLGSHTMLVMAKHACPPIRSKKMTEDSTVSRMTRLKPSGFSIN